MRILKQTLLKLTKVKYEGKNGVKMPFIAIVVSILAHLLFVFLLYFISERQPPHYLKNPKRAIKSYLYQMPAKPLTVNTVVVKPTPKAVKAVKIIETIKTIKTIKTIEKVNIDNQLTTLESSQLVKNRSSTRLLNAKPQASIEPQKPAQATFSAYQQLKKLRHSINEKILADELAELQQFRSPSVMHGEQFAVPHSSKKLTPAQKRAKNTSRLSESISITKSDNGICVIDRKQFLGSTVEGSSAVFNCGKSKFEKSFSDHMKKVQQKLIWENKKH